jgi:hypothetical protein
VILYKTPNVNPTDVFREHLSLNASSFSGTNNDCDWYRQAAIVAATPTRVALLTDTTAWATNPTDDSWNTRLHGSASGANKNATQQGGQLT